MKSIFLFGLLTLVSATGWSIENVSVQIDGKYYNCTPGGEAPRLKVYCQCNNSGFDISAYLDVMTFNPLTGEIKTSSRLTRYMTGLSREGNINQCRYDEPNYPVICGKK